MEDKTIGIIGAIIIIFMIIGACVGLYYFNKWNNGWVEDIKSYCPEDTKLTDYSYARSHLGIDGELYGLECDGVVMDFKIKINRYMACERHNKWNQCNMWVEKYNSTKIGDANVANSVGGSK